MDELLDSVLHQIVQQLITSEGDLLAIALRGSHVTGRVTSTSDVDLFVITNSTGPQSLHLFQAGYDFHVRRLPKGYLIYEIMEGNLRYFGFFLHARALHDPANVFSEIKKMVEAIPATKLAIGWLNEVKHQASDAEGQLEKGDTRTALYLVRYAGFLLAQTALLTTSQATYKHKDVIASLLESPSLEYLQDAVLKIMDINAVDREVVSTKMELLRSAIESVEAQISGRNGQSAGPTSPV